jgi:hypothetical protein
MTFDENVFYEAPGPSQSSDDLAAYLEYFNNPHNQKKYQYEYSGFRVPAVRCWETAIPLIRKPSFR